MTTPALRVLVVDDEAFARERMRSMLLQTPGVEVLDSAGDADEAKARVAAGGIDVLLLDIRMPGTDGMALARQLNGHPDAPCVVFVTAHEDQALPAFEARAVDYVVKPVRKERLQLALERAREHLLGRAARHRQTGQGPHFVSKTRGLTRRIPFEDVRYLYADEKNVTAWTEAGAFMVEGTLKGIEEAHPDVFLRIHRNCLVARAALDTLRRDAEGHAWVVLRAVPVPLEVSRRCLAQVKAAFEARA